MTALGACQLGRTYTSEHKEDAESVYNMLISCTDAIRAYRRRALAWFVTASEAP
jgi:hypothetical protein